MAGFKVGRSYVGGPDLIGGGEATTLIGLASETDTAFSVTPVARVTATASWGRTRTFASDRGIRRGTATWARSRGWVGTPVVKTIAVIPHGVGYEISGRTRGWAAIALVDVPPEPLDPQETMIPGMRETYSAPVLVHGQPFADSGPGVELALNPWTPDSVDRPHWGRFHIVISGTNVTSFRRYDLGAGKKIKTIVSRWSDKDPGGDDQADLIFPGITPFDELGVGSLSWLYPDAPVTIKRVHADGTTVTTVFEGVVGPLEDTVADPSNFTPGGALIVHCIGLWDRLDDFITLPRPSIDQYIEPIPIGHLTPIDMAQFIWAHVHRAQLYGWPGDMRRPDNAGILTGEQGSYGDPIASRTILQMLAQMQTAGAYYTVMSQDRRRLTLTTRSWELGESDFSLWCGQRGVTHNLTLDPTVAFNAFYGQGVAPFGPIDPDLGRPPSVAEWANWQYPFAIDSIPAYPLPTGQTFIAGDGHVGFSPFSTELNSHGYNLDSGDSYLISDVDEVRRFQSVSGILVDGIVGPQTWNQAFQTGVNAKVLASAYVKELYTGYLESPFLTNGRGGIVGPNPLFSPRFYPRRETMEQFGSVTKKNAVKSAKEEYDRIKDPIYRGTITARNIDPPEMNALSTKAGMTMILRGHRGQDRQFYIAAVERQPGMDPAGGSDRTVTWTVSERPEGHMTIAQRLERRLGIKDLVASNRPPRHSAKVVESFPLFDAESGAGLLPPGQNQTGGLWNKYLIPMGGQVDVSAVKIIADENTMMAAAVFGNPYLTVNDLIALPGLADPSNGVDGVTDPWTTNQDKLVDMGICWATGAPGAMQGYWPNDPGGDLTGVLADLANWSFRANSVWGSLFVWCADSCGISGDPTTKYRAIFPQPLF